MIRIYAFLILLLASSAFAGEGYVTCRQLTWASSGDRPVYSLKDNSCVRMKTSFFESMDMKAHDFCEEWRKDENVTDLYTIRIFKDQVSCVQDVKDFQEKELMPVRPVVTDGLGGSQYFWFTDEKAAYIDKDTGRERARWVSINGDWFCSLPGQNFFVRYDFSNGNKDMYVEGLSLNLLKFGWKLDTNNSVIWVNTDLHSPFVEIENTLSPNGVNTFTVRDGAGNTVNLFQMSYFVDTSRSPLTSCY